MEPLVRARDTRSLLLTTPEGTVAVSKQTFLKEHGLDGLIRIESDDFALLPNTGLYAHFNLEQANHLPDKRYGLIHLVQHGSLNQQDGGEQLPLLTPTGMRMARCIAYEGGVSFESVTPRHFAHALPSCKDRAALTVSILRRYRQSLPGITDEELLARGVAYTLLEIEPS
jgi:hypothetical protein